MNRQFKLAAVITVTLGALLILAAPPALAAPIGGVIVIPGNGTNLDPIRLRTSAGCPAQADAYYATMRGHGFSPNGQIVTSNTQAGLSHKIGFDVYVALVMQDYANANRTTLTVAMTSRCTASTTLPNTTMENSPDHSNSLPQPPTRRLGWRCRWDRHRRRWLNPVP